MSIDQAVGPTTDRSGGPAAERSARVGDRMLATAATCFAVAVLLHDSDHIRRGAGAVSGSVVGAGTASIFLEVALVVLVFQRHRVAPLAAAVGGFGLATGYVVVHFLPTHPWLSDSFTSSRSVSPLSWVAASLEVCSAAAFGLAGLVVLRRRGGLASAARVDPAQRPLGEALRQPVVALMIAGNIVAMVVSFAQLAIG